MKFMRLIWMIGLFPIAVSGQQSVKGTVKNEQGESLPGVNIAEKGTSNGTYSNARGEFELRVAGGSAKLIFTYIGYEKKEVAVDGRSDLDVVLKEGTILMNETQVVGTRSYNRTVTSTPVPVDVIDMRDIPARMGVIEINQLLQVMAPSFNANKQSGADGADHIDPATLRGLGPDQTLVLINGKRYHQSSLVNIFGTRGRGNTGTDLNTIPTAAIERIEILRDGASAQYGSDAIAGVMNIVLKNSVEEFTGSASYGSNYANPGDKPYAKSNGTFDGGQMNVNANYGIKLGESGFANFTADYMTRGKTNRPADKDLFSVYREKYGDASGQNMSLFVNSSYPINDNLSFYAFGGYNFRYTDAYAWTRDPGSERNVTAIYPNGFNPRITSDINDFSVSTGFKTRFSGWDVDINNTVGSNKFQYNIKHTLNATLEAASPTHFDAGGFQLLQNTTGIHFSKSMPGVSQGLNLAFGSEFRIDQYEIFAGEDGSWKSYGRIFFGMDGSDSIFRPAGSQGFPGFRPDDEIKKSRTNVGMYADAELDVTKEWLVATALRFENYSDFGSTLNGKLASRYKVSDNLTVRGSASTGFRAPSLPQIYFNSTFTDFVGGQPIDKVIARNNSALAKALGIPKLKEEKATDISAGFTFDQGDFSGSVDAYQVRIKDRIVLTGAFDNSDPNIAPILDSLGVGAVQFFTNALDTKTTGLDVVLNHNYKFGDQRLRTTLAVNLNQMSLGKVDTVAGVSGKDIYFTKREERFLLASAPSSKLVLTFDHQWDRLNSNLQFVRFGTIKLEDWSGNVDTYKSKIITNLTFGYAVTDHMTISAGAQNLFNTYPTRQDPADTETGGLWDAVQMGFSGVYYFSRLTYRF